MSNILNDNDNKLNLLFKKFQSVSQATINTDGTNGTPFSLEQVSTSNNVFQKEIFAEDVPIDLSFSIQCSTLHDNASIPDSSWNNNVYDQSLSYVDLSMNGKPLPLRFYKNVYLNQTIVNEPQVWWLLDNSLATPRPDNNVLKNMIPFSYNINTKDVYSPIVSYYDGSNWVTNGQNDSTKLNWLVDYPSGLLQFYQTDSILSGLNITNSSDTSIEKIRPRISFIKYTGQTGTGGNTGGGGGGTGSGLVKVGELSGNTVISSQDVSAIYFDKEAFDISLVDQTAKITFVGTGSAKVSDLSYYFFDVPNDLSGTGDLSMGTPFGGTNPSSFICLSLILPPQTKSAVPFGTSKQYGNPASNPANEADLPIKYLPFFDELKIQYKDWSVNQDYKVGWTDLSINNSSPYKQTHIPPTITRVNLGYATSNAVVELKDKSDNINNLNPPFITYNNNVQLQIGKVYQFRLFLTNNGDEKGIVDPIYGGDVSFNYLYIPGISGEGISLGSFGSATAPTQIFFSPAELTNYTLQGSNNDPSGADQSGNVPFPIFPGLNYEVFYGFDLSQIPLKAGVAKQMPEYRNLIPEANFTYETSATRLKTWQAPNTTISSELVYPETKYHAFNYYMRNNVQDFSGVKSYARDSSHLDPPGIVDPSYTTGIPTRSQASAKTDRMQSTTLSFSETSGITTTQAIPINSAVAQDIYFLKDLSNAEFDIGKLPGPFANNLNPSFDTSFVGLDSSGVELTFIQIKSLGNTAGVNFDASTNKTVGYLDVSNISISNGDTSFFTLDASSNEAGSTPDLQKKGYYTDVSINQAKLLSVSLANYPDICNNNYDKYTVTITDTYNGGGPGPFLTGNNASGEIGIGRKPGQINYSLNSYANPTVSLDRNFFGLKMPDLRTTATDITLDYSYNLQNIALWWKPITTNISTSSAIYNPSALSSKPRYKIDTKNRVWPIGSEVPSIDVIPNNQIRREVWTNNTSSWNGGERAYSRDVADISFSGSQFSIETKYNDNVTYWTSDYTQNAPSQDVSFGNPGKYLWWDSTWDNNNSVQPTNQPDVFFSTNLATSITFIQAIGNSSSGFNTLAGQYNHADDLTSTSVGYRNKQLIWANGGFRPAGTSGKNNPYVDFTTYYNPGSVLKDYSNLALTGESISTNYNGQTGNNRWWDTGISAPSASINRKLKYISFNIDMPFTDVIPGSPSATNYIFQIEITNYQKDNSTSGAGNGYWVYHNENDNATPVATQQGPFDGQGIAGLGNGSFIFNQDGYRISNPSGNTSSNLKTTLQISIGFPHNLSSPIEDVTINFLKY